jgi:hypothetical protein
MKFIVTEKHGRVFRPTADPTRRILVANPGDEISMELARECGLLDEDDGESVKDSKPETVKRDSGKEAPSKLSTYPTKVHKA